MKKFRLHLVEQTSKQRKLVIVKAANQEHAEQLWIGLKKHPEHSRFNLSSVTPHR
jgi:hypothetical protein